MSVNICPSPESIIRGVRMGKFEIKPTSNGGYMFNLVANNHQVICTSQVYASLANCKAGAESVRNNCGVDVEDQTVEGYQPLKNPKYEVYIDAGGKTRFRLKASNGEIIATSQAYADKQSCLKGIRSIASHAPDAEIVVVEAEGEDGS